MQEIDGLIQQKNCRRNIEKAKKMVSEKQSRLSRKVGLNERNIIPGKTKELA